MADTLIDMTTGRFTPKQTAGQVFANSSGCGALRVAQLESPGTELTRAGRRFSISTLATATGIAPTQVINTTAANWVLWNTSTTDSFLFDEIGAFLASGVAGLGITVMACFLTAPAQVSLATGITVASRSASLRTSAIAIKSGVTITTPAAPQWFPVAYFGQTPTAINSVIAVSDNLNGKLICPPLTGVGLHVLSPTGTSPLFTPHASWVEMAMDNE